MNETSELRLFFATSVKSSFVASDMETVFGESWMIFAIDNAYEVEVPAIPGCRFRMEVRVPLRRIWCSTMMSDTSIETPCWDAITLQPLDDPCTRQPPIRKQVFEHTDRIADDQPTFGWNRSDCAIERHPIRRGDNLSVVIKN